MFGGKQVPIVLQTEAAECGLACLAMIAGWHGHRTDLVALRARFLISLKGVNLSHLVQYANRLDLSSRALRLDVNELHQLALPCILHWDLSDFVVLVAVNRRGIIIHDPAIGKRSLSSALKQVIFSGTEMWCPSSSGADKAALTLPSVRLGRELVAVTKQVKEKTSGVKLMAFGHRVYNNVDPRAKLMRATYYEATNTFSRARCIRTSRVYPHQLFVGSAARDFQAARSALIVGFASNKNGLRPVFRPYQGVKIVSIAVPNSFAIANANGRLGS